ncbi:hypothetical protein [Clostridium thermarum]|uniref:hypothetical protein n=1 Tax=Clostridium thermarum TaxID=1716543 RepID=UPI001120B3FD|nr:hypothetical protein [Clostridium thermarum]
MKNLSRSDKLILIGLAFLGVLFIYYQFVLNPLLNTISDTKFSIEQNKAQAEEISNMERNNRVMAAAIEKLKVDYEKFKQTLPVELRDPEIQTSLNLQALSSKVQVKSINFGDSSLISLDGKSDGNNNKIEKGSLMMVPVTINLQGDYLAAMDYIKGLEESERISEVKTINITKSDQGVNLGVVINYYYVAGDAKDKQELDYEINVPVGNKDNLFN